MGAMLTGDWKKLNHLLLSRGGLGVNMRKVLWKANAKNALILVKEFKLGIRSQAPGGKQFAPLADSTKARKGSSKALIDTSFLVNSITQKLMGDKAFAGLLKGVKNKEGDDIANIGAIMEFGATIPNGKGGAIIIPARPFIHPVMIKQLPTVKHNYKVAMQSVFR